MPAYLANRLDRLTYIRGLVNEGEDVPAEDADFLLQMVDRLGAVLIGTSHSGSSGDR